jgi:HAMP domain-containing protein
MALVYLLPFAVGLLSILRSSYSIPQEVLQISRSLGIMVALAAFAVVYLNYLPETTSFMVRLVGIGLVTLLTVTSAMGWLAAPAYAAQFRASLPDQRTLRFTPNAAGGYDVSLIPFHFETDPSAGSPQTTRDDAGQGLGANLHLLDWRHGTEQERWKHEAPLSFVFPYYGKTYDRLYAYDDGAIAFGRGMDSYFSFALHYGGSTPMLLPLLLDLNPGAAEGDVFVRQEAERLIITWQRVPGFYRPEDVYTFQAVLYADGVFEFSYNGLPVNLGYHLDAEPSASAWAIGAVPGDLSRSPQIANLGILATGGAAAVSGGPQGIVHDYYLDFRRYLHPLLLPLAYLMLGASLLMLLAFPWLFRLNLVKPLEALLAGVRRANAGDLNATTPVQFRDEIGFLTESFNTMTESLPRQC